MNLIQRAFKSITRRTSKSLVLFGIIFLLGNLLCASLAISTSVSQLENDFINQLGAKIEIQQNPNKYIEYNQQYEKDLQSLLNNIEYINNRNYVKFSDNHYTLSGLQSNHLIFENEVTTIDGTLDSLSILLYGCGQPHFFDILENKMQLIEGRLFTEEELKNGEHVVVLSNRFYTKEDNQIRPIQIGDTLTLSRNVINVNDFTAYQGENTEFKVIGIVEKIESLEKNNKYTIENNEARFYVPNAVVQKEDEIFQSLNQEHELNTNRNRMMFYKTEFKLTQPKYTETFETHFNKDLTLVKSFEIKTSKDVYDKIAAPINTLSIIAEKLITITTISVIVILSLVVVLFLKDRRQEIGILFAMGEHRIKIVTQVMMELLLIGWLAISLAMISGRQIGNAYSNFIIENQRETSQYFVVENISQEEVLDNYTMTFNQEYIQSVYVTTTSVILISTILPTAYILHLKPRKILL